MIQGDKASTHYRYSMESMNNDALLEMTEDIKQSVCDVAKHPVSGQNALYAKRAFKKDEVLTPFGSTTRSSVPNYLTVQIGDDLHIELYPPVLQYMNHSCEPNCFFDTTRMEVVALRDIEDGEELSFFYPSTEWDMAQPFECLCGTASCLKTIQGARHIDRNVLKNYRLSDYIMSKL